MKTGDGHRPNFPPLADVSGPSISVLVNTSGLYYAICNMSSNTRVRTQTQRGRAGKKWVGLNYKEKERAKEANGMSVYSIEEC